MQIRGKDQGGTTRTYVQIRARDELNSTRVIKRVRLRDGGNVTRTVYDITVPGAVAGTDVVLSTYEVYEAKTSSGAITLTTDTIGSLVSYGTGPYTYLWEYVSGSTAIIAVNPTVGQTRFRASNITGDKITVFRLKVTDSLASVKYSANITIELEQIARGE